MSFGGRLDIDMLRSWEEEIGANAATASFHYFTMLAVTYVGYRAFLVLNKHRVNLFPSAQQDKGWFSSLVHGVKDIIALPYRFISGKSTNFKNTVGLAATLIGPQVVMHEVIKPAIEYASDGAIEARAVGFMRPFMEKIMPKLYSVFDRGDLEISARSFIPNEMKNPGLFASAWNWGISIPGYILTSPVRVYRLYRANFHSQKWAQERMGKVYYGYGEKALEVCQGDIPKLASGLYNTVYDILAAPVNGYKCLADGHSTKECADYAANWVARKADTTWSYLKPVASAGLDLSSWGFDKFKQGANNLAQNASEYSGGYVTPKQALWGSTGVLGLTVGLLTWRYGHNAWEWFWRSRVAGKGATAHIVNVHNHQPPPPPVLVNRQGLGGGNNGAHQDAQDPQPQQPQPQQPQPQQLQQ